MTIPIPAIFDFELHATVLGHPATVALRRVKLGTMHWCSYEYRISPTTTCVVVARLHIAVDRVLADFKVRGEIFGAAVAAPASLEFKHDGQEAIGSIHRLHSDVSLRLWCLPL
jgi:hypothetical protein